MVNNSYTMKFKLGSEHVYFDDKASVSAITKCVQDTVIEHTKMMEIDRKVIFDKFNAYWVIAKMRITMDEFPLFEDEIEIETYPLQPTAVKFEREAVIRKNNREIGRYESLWCLVDAEKKRIRRGSSIDYPDMEHRARRFGDDYCAFIIPEMTEKNYMFSHTVALSDIDFNIHMNNVSYLKLAFDTLTMDEYVKLGISCAEINFKAQLYYGENLKLFRKDAEDGIYVLGTSDDGVHVFELKFSSR